MKKAFLILTAVAFVAAMASCGGNNNTEATENDNAQVAETPAADVSAQKQENVLYRTNWEFTDGETTGKYTTYSLNFKQTNCFYQVSDHTCEPAKYTSAYGSYTFDEATGKGSADLKDQNNDKPMGKAEFAINGEEMSLTFDGKTLTLKKK